MIDFLEEIGVIASIHRHNSNNNICNNRKESLLC